MAQFSQRSLNNMKGLHPYLVMLLNYAIQYFDFVVTSGVRTDDEQAALYAKGRTKPGNIVTHIDGKERRSSHQKDLQTGCGHAVDIYPYPVRNVSEMSEEAQMKERWRYVALAYFLKGLWKALKETGGLDGELRWGGDWDSDNEFSDQSFDDLVHFELNL